MNLSFKQAIDLHQCLRYGDGSQAGNYQVDYYSCLLGYSQKLSWMQSFLRV